MKKFTVVLLLVMCGLSLEHELVRAEEVSILRKFANLPRQINNTYLLTHATELQTHRRSFIEVQFKRIDEEGLVWVEIINLTNRDIDDIRGGFRVEDKQGNYLFSSGYTEAVPGSVFLRSGERKEFTIFGLKRKPKVVQMIKKAPKSINFYFEAREIIYMDGSREDTLKQN